MASEEQPKPQIKVLVLDCGGVVLTAQRSQEYKDLLQSAAPQLNVATGAEAKACFYESEEWKLAKIGKMPADEFFYRCCKNNNMEGAAMDPATGEVSVAVKAVQKKVREGGRGVHPDMLALLRDLQPYRASKQAADNAEKGAERIITVAMLSNYDLGLEEVLDAVDVTEKRGITQDSKERTLNQFDLVLNSAAIGMAKPDPRCYEHTMVRLGLDPVKDAASVLFVDDKSRNTATAEEFGWNCVTFQDKVEDVKKIRSLLGI